MHSCWYVRQACGEHCSCTPGKVIARILVDLASVQHAFVIFFSEYSSRFIRDAVVLLDLDFHCWRICIRHQMILLVLSSYHCLRVICHQVLRQVILLVLFSDHWLRCIRHQVFLLLLLSHHCFLCISHQVGCMHPLLAHIQE